MLTDLQEKWCQALESDKYEQTFRKLYDGKNGYCCLGIGAVVAGYKPIEHNGKYFFGSIDAESNANILAREIQQKLGLDSYNGLFSKNGITCLSELNDKRVSFKEIAAIIRSEPEGLFAKVL